MAIVLIEDNDGLTSKQIAWRYSGKQAKDEEALEDNMWRISAVPAATISTGAMQCAEHCSTFVVQATQLMTTQ